MDKSNDAPVVMMVLLVSAIVTAILLLGMFWSCDWSSVQQCWVGR